MFLPEGEWLPWAVEEDWQANIVAYKRYDMAVAGPGQKLADLLRATHPQSVEDFLPIFAPLEIDERRRVESMSVQPGNERADAPKEAC